MLYLFIDGTVELVWSIYIGTKYSVVGQIIGHKDTMLVATAYDGSGGDNKLIGVQLH